MVMVASRIDRAPLLRVFERRHGEPTAADRLDLKEERTPT
jgi:hypothetical protein